MACFFFFFFGPQLVQAKSPNIIHSQSCFPRLWPFHPRGWRQEKRLGWWKIWWEYRERSSFTWRSVLTWSMTLLGGSFHALVLQTPSGKVFRPQKTIQHTVSEGVWSCRDWIWIESPLWRSGLPYDWLINLLTSSHRKLQIGLPSNWISWISLEPPNTTEKIAHVRKWWGTVKHHHTGFYGCKGRI